MKRLGFPVTRYASVESTMDEITRLASEGAPEGMAVIADVQRSGRGRAGRRWETPPGSAFLCSILLRPSLAVHLLSLLPIAAGLAIAEAIESIAPVRCQLKWPNDVLISGRKVAGILAQTRAIGERVDHVNLGFGVNLTTDITQLPGGATSILRETGMRIDAADFEHAVFDRLSQRYDAFCAADGELDLGSWLDRSYLLGDMVKVVDGDRELIGIHRGIDANGALLLETEAGMRAVVSGDLTRGPRRLTDA